MSQAAGGSLLVKAVRTPPAEENPWGLWVAWQEDRNVIFPGRDRALCSQDAAPPLPSSLPPHWALEPRASLANITWGCVRVGGSRQYM